MTISETTNPTSLERPSRQAARRTSVVHSTTETKIMNRAGRLLADTAHDLRGPLAVTVGMLQTVLDDELNPISADQCDQMLTALDRCGEMRRLIEDMLDYDRVRSGLPRVCRSIVDVNQLRLSVESIVSKEAVDREITLAWRGLDQTAPLLWADQEKLRRFLVNLTMNALKETPAGGRVTIYLAHGDGSNVRIGVRDTGHGFDANDLARVVQDGRVKVDGLGITICRQIAALHHSWLWLNSEPDRGTCFEIFVPQASPAAAATSLARWRNGRPAASNDLDGFIPLPDNQPLPRYPEVALNSLSIAGLADTHAEDIDRIVQNDIRMHETTYRVGDNGWILAWDLASEHLHERREQLAENILGVLAPVGISIDCLHWSIARWFRADGGNRSAIVEAFVRSALELNRQILPLSSNVSSSSNTHTALEDKTTHEKVNQRLKHEMRRLATHFRDRQVALARSVPSKQSR